MGRTMARSPFTWVMTSGLEPTSAKSGNCSSSMYGEGLMQRSARYGDGPQADLPLEALGQHDLEVPRPRKCIPAPCGQRHRTPLS